MTRRATLTSSRPCRTPNSVLDEVIRGDRGRDGHAEHERGAMGQLV